MERVLRVQSVDVVVIGAGAAGMMCAIEAAKRGRSVLIVDHAQAPGEKIRISGGGRCNFTNLHASKANYLSQNPSFCISALRRYSQRDFIGLIEAAGIAYHERTLGQLFCDGSALQIVELLVRMLKSHGATLQLGTSVSKIEKTEGGFSLVLDPGGSIACQSLVVACGGKSIPKMGATGFGYEIAQQFGIRIIETRPALVPLTLDPASLDKLGPLAGIALDITAAHGKTAFNEAMLFTHRGLSGPAILQISSYWRQGEEIVLRLVPGTDIFATLKAARRQNGRQAIQTALATLLPKRLAQYIAESLNVAGNLADLSDAHLRRVDAAINQWRLKPAGSEGYRTAEVTLGGVDTNELDSRTMAVKSLPSLSFIGEVVDVTGWLGGYNFQWAWSSGWCAGQSV
jgi:predicted Rossmann fold flavoprotein